jgi:hypothetical protein
MKEELNFATIYFKQPTELRREWIEAIEKKISVEIDIVGNYDGINVWFDKGEPVDKQRVEAIAIYLGDIVSEIPCLDTGDDMDRYTINTGYVPGEVWIQENIGNKGSYNIILDLGCFKTQKHAKQVCDYLNKIGRTGRTRGVK